MSNKDPVGDNGSEHTADDSGEYTVRQKEGARGDMDPGLLNILLSLENDEGGEFIPDKVRAQGYIDIIAELADPDEEVEGLTVVQKIGRIITGTVNLQKIKSVHRHPNVIRLEQARNLYPTLDRSVYEIRAHREQFREAQPIGAKPLDGSGVIVGIVDRHCDFAHPNFCVQGENGTDVTRLLFLRDQRRVLPTTPRIEYPDGREFGREMINDALKLLPKDENKDKDEVYKKLQYQPDDEAHGTHVMDIAVGNGRGTCNPGVAPCADIIFVHLETEDPDNNETPGNSRRLLEAVKYIFDKAVIDGKPSVVNISLNRRAGPHDGSTLIEKGFEELLRAPGRAIVIAAGNWRNTNGHASGVIETGRTHHMRWEIREGDKTDNQVEIWYGGAHELELLLRTPGGNLLGPFALDTVTGIYRDEAEVARVSHGQSYTDNRDHLITINFSTAIQPGDWMLLLHSLSAAPVTFHAWIAGDPGGQSRFAAEDADHSHTVGAISCGESTLVVGSYNPLKPRSIAADSSAGPTRDGKLKPEVSAPGEGINVAEALFDKVIDSRSGTSLAAPHVAGMIALMMQAAIPCKLTTEQIRTAVIRSARKEPPHAQEWEPCYGHGRIDALSAALTQF